MDNEKNITRREALKTMGAIVAGARLGIGGLHAATSFGVSDKETNMRKMKVLLVNGSPHKEGCTYTALSEVAGFQRSGSRRHRQNAFRKIRQSVTETPVHDYQPQR